MTEDEFIGFHHTPKTIPKIDLDRASETEIVVIKRQILNLLGVVNRVMHRSSTRCWVWCIICVERGMMNVFYMVVGILLSVGLFEYAKYLFRGYIIYQDGPENLVYKERGKDKLFFYVTLRYNDERDGGVDIHVPAIEKWKREMPDWAKYRKPIIVQRLKSHLKKIDNSQVVDYK